LIIRERKGPSIETITIALRIMTQSILAMVGVNPLIGEGKWVVSSTEMTNQNMGSPPK
jgi:hypothetical protein